MSGTPGNPIMETAIALLMELPNAPAMTILDRAMKGHEGSHPDFDSWCGVRLGPHPAFGDDLYPPSPFAELLRRAFAPQFDPREAAVLGLVDQDVEPEVQARLHAADERWQVEVITRFAERAVSTLAVMGRLCHSALQDSELPQPALRLSFEALRDRKWIRWTSRPV